MYELIARISLGIYQENIVHDFGLSSGQFALLSSTAFSITIGLLQIPAALMFQKYGLKKCVLLSSALGIFCNCALFFVDQYSAFFSLRFLSAIGASFGYMAAFIGVLVLIPKRHHGLFVGLSCFLINTGAAFYEGPIHHFIQLYKMNWHSIFLIFLIIKIIIFLTAFKLPSSSLFSRDYQRPRYTDFSAIWKLIVFSVCIIFTVDYLCQNHGRMLFIAKGIPPLASSYLLSAVWIGIALFSPFFGYLFDRFCSYISILLTCTAGFFISLFIIIYGSGSLTSSVFWFFMFGVFSSGQNIIYALVPRMVAPQYCAFALGLISTLNLSATGIFSPVLSFWVDTYSLMPSLIDYQKALIPLCFIAATPLVIMSVEFITHKNSSPLKKIHHS